MEKAVGIVIGCTLHPNGRISQYVIYKPNGIITMTPTEVYKDIQKDLIKVVGLRRAGKSVTLSGYFKHKGVIGEPGTDEVWTPVCVHVHKDFKRYDLSDRLGNIRNISEEDLVKEIKDKNILINGAYIRKEKPILSKSIPVEVEQ